jgi:hypothetical protein
MSRVAQHPPDPRIALGIRGRGAKPLPAPRTGEQTQDCAPEQAIRDAPADLLERP